MRLLSIIIFSLISVIVNGTFYNSNLTDFSKCKVYYSRSGSIYKDFFEFNEHPQNGSLLDFHFSVLSPSDAHILLAPSSNIEKDDPVYEIVIGAGGNTFCDIRRMKKSLVKATARVKGLLSGLDIHSFWIHINKEGIIEVGKEGQDLAFLTWTDPDPLPLKVFSFSTWPGIEAKWFYDCPRNNNSSNSKKIEKPLMDLERLRKDLLFFYDPYVRPVYNPKTITVVTLQLSTTIVVLDEHEASLLYSGTITLTWQDEKLHWNSSHYGEINELHIFRREIWVPNLYLFDAIGDGSDILQDTFLTVNATGFVTWTTTTNMKSWCSPNDLGRWPRDEHSCDMILGFLKDFDNLQLEFKANESSFSCPYSSTWAITEVNSFSNKGWKNDSARDIRMFDPPGMTLNFTLRRTSNIYTLLLFSPFFVIVVSLLSIFWSSPFGNFKIALACLQLVVAVLMLIGLGLIIPIHSKLVPNLVLLYSYSLVAIVICIVIETFVINLSRNEHKTPLPHILNQALLSAFLKWFLCLPEIKRSKRYGNLNSSFPKLNENQQPIWILLGVVVDRIAFFVYLGLAVYALCITY